MTSPTTPRSIPTTARSTTSTAWSSPRTSAGFGVIVDFVPCHTSVEHPWFRERPDFYVWMDAPANNWVARFGGSAWERDPVTGRYYLHSFFPEQPDLNWRNPHVRAEMQSALRFWLERGVDGFRLDAIARLFKDPEPVTIRPPASRSGCRCPRTTDASAMSTPPMHRTSAWPCGRFARRGRRVLIGEVYLPTAQLRPYTEILDVLFAFEPMHAGADTDRLKTTVAAAIEGGKLGWVLSNHDFARFASRFGENFRAASVLFLSLPGPLFVYQGDELGTPDGPGADPPLDRNQRDRFRHPMQWNGSPTGGFTTGIPWLPPNEPQLRNVADQEQDQESVLEFFRRLIRLRRDFGSAARLLDSPPGTVVLERGGHLVAVNLGDASAPFKRRGELALETRRGDGADPDTIPAHAAWIARV